MIAYVDTSTIIKLVIDERGSDRAREIWNSADTLASVSLVEVEARAALAAARRAKRVTAAEHRRARTALDSLLDQLDTIAVTDAVVGHASDLAEKHGLRGYDAVHLAGAKLVNADLLTSADEALCQAAANEGIRVANPLDG